MATDTLSRRRATTRDLLYFTHPHLWPHYPFLPVARRVRDGDRTLQCGVLHDGRGVSGTYGYGTTVFLVNLFVMPRTEAGLLARPKCVYDTVEELADDGWVVG
ncbi:MAG TPA: hypothetical protein VG013_27670 [Gemmataceae bacterium]|jgi:hypothetical protein|nr:hypothetical protein [Gemmataceae bacterium]